MHSHIPALFLFCFVFVPPFLQSCHPAYFCQRVKSTWALDHFLNSIFIPCCLFYFHSHIYLCLSLPQTTLHGPHFRHSCNSKTRLLTSPLEARDLPEILWKMICSSNHLGKKTAFVFASLFASLCACSVVKTTCCVSWMRSPPSFVLTVCFSFCSCFQNASCRIWNVWFRHDSHTAGTRG